MFGRWWWWRRREWEWWWSGHESIVFLDKEWSGSVGTFGREMWIYLLSFKSIENFIYSIFFFFFNYQLYYNILQFI